MMTISYRMLATIVGVVLLFGVGAAFVVDDDDDESDQAAAVTTTTSPDDDESDDDEDKDDETTTTSDSSTTSTTAAGATSTTAASGATTTTTRRPGATTTTTRRPGATTTTATPQPTVTAPPTTQPADAADLLVHADITGDNATRRVVLRVENAGPDGAGGLRLTASGAGAPIRSVQAGSGFSCSDNGSTVTCESGAVGVGGRIREVIIEFGVSPGCPGAPVLTANVSSSTPDPNPGNNSLTPRSLCPAAGSS